MKYFVELEFGVVGCTGYEVIEAKSQKAAEKEAYELCIDHAGSYGYEQDEEHFGDLDSVGLEWDEEEEDYSEQGFINPSVQPYVPEQHEGYLV